YRTLDWPSRRSRFFRRLVLAALSVLVLSVAGTVALAWLAASTLGVVTPAGQRAAAVLLAGGIGGVGVAVFVFVGIMRRVALPVGGVMDAADRVAAGNYEVRVTEAGPAPVRA